MLQQLLSLLDDPVVRMCTSSGLSSVPPDKRRTEALKLELYSDILMALSLREVCRNFIDNQLFSLIQ